MGTALTDDTADALTKQLLKARIAMFTSTFLSGLARWTAVNLGIWGLLLLGDSLIALPVELRLPLAVFAFTFTGCTLYKWVIKPARHFYSLDQTALKLEKRYGIPRNLLINSYQLSHQELTEEEAELARQTVRQGVGWVSKFKDGDVWEVKTLLKISGVAFVVFAGFLFFASFAPDHLKSSFKRFSLLFADVPPPGNVSLTVNPARDITVAENENHEVYLLVEPRRRHRESADTIADHYPRIAVEEAASVGISRSDTENSQNMIPVADSQIRESFESRTGHEATEENLEKYASDFEKRALRDDSALFLYQFREMRHPLAFRIFHNPGRTYTKSYRVKVESAPEIVESEFRITPPQYTGRPQKQEPGPPRSIHGLPGSRLQIVVQLDRPVNNLFWLANEDKVQFEEFGSSTWKAQTHLQESTSYEIFTSPDDGEYRQIIAGGNLLAHRDNPPYVEFVTKLFNREAWPGETIRVKLRAKDDYGVSAIILTAERTETSEADRREMARWNLQGPPGGQEPEPVTYMLRMDPSILTPGEDYLFRAQATDFHPDRQTGESNPLLVNVKSMDDMPDNFDVSNAFEALEKAIGQQRRALSNTRNVINYMDAVLGQDPDSPGFSFYNHRAQIFLRQQRVGDLLKEVTAQAADSHNQCISELKNIQQNHVEPLIKRIGKLSHDTEPWFSHRERVVEEVDDDYRGMDGQEIRFNGKEARYVGIRMKNTSGSFSLSKLEFMENGEIIPPPYIDQFKLAPIYKEWDGPVAFVNINRADLNNITEKALNAELQGTGNEIMNLRGMVKGAPDRNAALYAARTLHCEEARRVFLYAGSSDTLRVWVNGNLQISSLTRRSARPDQERVGVRLRKGKNIVVAEISAGDRDPALAMRFTERDGTPLALTGKGRFVDALTPEIVHVGSGTETAGNALDRNLNSRWRVENDDRDPLLIADIGHTRNLSGIKMYIHNGTFDTLDVYAADDLKVYNSMPPIIEEVENQQEEILDNLAAVRTAWLEREGESAGMLAAHREETEDDMMEENPKLEEESGIALASEDLKRASGVLLDAHEEALKLSEQRNSVLDQYGEDFTGEAMKELERIKERERELGEKMRDSVQDISQLGDLDISDAVQARAIQELFEGGEDISDLMEQKALEDIPQRTSNLDDSQVGLAEEIKNQLEILDMKPVDMQFVREESEHKKTPIPLPELPDTLRDLYGEIEEQQQPTEFVDDETIGGEISSFDMEGETEQVSSGTESGVSAEGVTGQEQPEEMGELEGRSGFGRTGRASGEGVEDVAHDIPQDSVVPPERDTGTSLEEGMVEDRSTEAAAEATGLGKETDESVEFGMAGHLPPAVLDRLHEVAGQQAELRKNTRHVLMSLERHNLPTADFNRVLQALERIKKASEKGDMEEFRVAYDEALNSMARAEETIGQEIGLQHLKDRSAAIEGGRGTAAEHALPEGYEDLISEYFKALAGEEN